MDSELRPAGTAEAHPILFAPDDFFAFGATPCDLDPDTPLPLDAYGGARWVKAGDDWGSFAAEVVPEAPGTED